MSTLFSELERSTVGTATGINLNSTIIGGQGNLSSVNSASAVAVAAAVASNQLAAAAVAAVNAQQQQQQQHLHQQQQHQHQQNSHIQQTSMNILTSSTSSSPTISSSSSGSPSLTSSLSSVSQQQNNLMASALVVSSAISQSTQNINNNSPNNNINNNNSNSNNNNNNINNNNNCVNGVTVTNGMAIQVNPGIPNNSLNLNGSSANSSPTLVGGNSSSGGNSLSGISGIGAGNVTPGVPPSSGTPNNLVEDQRALQLAFELSMVGLSDGLANGGSTGMNSFASILPGMEDRSKKSQNMTECVPVPSSEHVAEIVGRQGCKIKALRAKTNTYIKTPVRGEEPVFVVTGRKEDVGKAKREILSAAEHFSLIRASRKPTLSGIGGTTGTNGKGAPPGPPANIPGQVTIQVRVPYRVVGLVVGPKGATIKHIQQQTHTYIVTPSRDKEPIFEVTGLPDNVQAARRQIEAHIALRTGNIGNLPNGGTNANAITAGINNGHHFNGNCAGGNLTNNGMNGVNLNGNANMNGTNGTSGISSLLGEDAASSEFLTSLCKNGFGSLLNYVEPTTCNLSGVDNTTGGPGNAYVPVVCSSSTPSTGGSRSCSSSSSSTSSKSGTANSRPELMNIWKNLSDSIDVDEGLGESPNIWTLPAVHSSSTLGSRCSPSISPTDSLLGGGGSTGSTVSNIMNCGNAGGNVVVGNGGGVGGVTMSIPGTTVVPSNLQICRRECLMCGDKEVTAALVPCGHNMFCMECANRVCGAGNGGICPVCSQTVVQAIRIIH